MAARLVFVFLAFTAGLQATDVWTWWVDPCTGVAVSSGCNQNDEELARWAFAGWQRESGDRIVFRKSPTAKHARLRVHWATDPGLYGETRSRDVDGKRGAEMSILPGTNASRQKDPLLRDAIVFLTFVHETGHALGLRHTSNFEDIMYSFQYGGDVNAYFDRYRKLITTRADIAKHSGLAAGDRAALLALFAK
ncbi:MAG TPA: matrixin family metalloprotease [Bryobacteraceae bacterium]|nr:matrixin family metalloprotease [Bryobacteraceae bacterium]